MSSSLTAVAGSAPVALEEPLCLDEGTSHCLTRAVAVTLEAYNEEVPRAKVERRVHQGANAPQKRRPLTEEELDREDGELSVKRLREPAISLEQYLAKRRHGLASPRSKVR